MRRTFRIIVLSFALLMFGCQPTPETRLIDARTSDVQSNVKVFGYFPYTVNKTFITSASYESIRENKIRALYDAWRQQLFDTNPHLIKYGESNDCDKFAMSFCSYVQNTYYELNYGIKPKAESFGIGIVFYKSKGKFNHAINVIITEENILFFEPQTGKDVVLSMEEIASIYLIMI